MLIYKKKISYILSFPDKDLLNIRIITEMNFPKFVLVGVIFT